MGRIEDRLTDLGLALPRPFAAPPGVEFRFDLVRVSGGVAYVSGHLPTDGAEILMRGKVDDDLTVQQGYEAARLTALAILASLKRELGELDRVGGWVKAFGLVNCSPGFSKMPAVINGFSELILELWGEAGRHARSAIGAAELPFDAPVEVEAIVEVA
jgi:enamine deaminase RidA (YjgF/YER057c/UK114 family)